jgi:gamma-F420-2:alpha-L-glutamate ligase
MKPVIEGVTSILNSINHSIQSLTDTANTTTADANNPSNNTDPSSQLSNQPSSPTPSSTKSSKPKDTDFPAYETRSFIEGTTYITISHMFNKDAPTIEKEVSNHWLQFNLQPNYLGHITQSIKLSINETHPSVFIYYNAQDPQFYYQTIKSPRMTIWLLIKNVTFVNGGYVKRRLVEEAILQNISMKLVNPNRFDLLVGTDQSLIFNADQSRRQVSYNGQPLDLPDCVIPRVGANVDYFGLAVMRQLESFGVKVFNPSASIEISRDKMYTHQVLAAAGLPIPKSVLSKWPFDVAHIESEFSYPVIMKLTSGSKGDAVWKIDSRQELIDCMATLDTTKPIIFQEFLADTKGRDLRCFVVGDKVVAAMMRIAASGFKANVHQGGSVLNVQVGPVLQALAVDTARLCLLDCSGVDVLLDSESYKICEVNSSPGFQGLEKACETNVALEVVNWSAKWVEEAVCHHVSNG